ncbi:unnamed protein product [Trichogramma brassicae]|uniref:Uncharacterized protein n=1 Tax=Trichogramma brassicae TaxID=86971 RepID=A0A6H5ITS8_9HYME|nr:unnamed protein product [Trichogramma brassicae]
MRTDCRTLEFSLRFPYQPNCRPLVRAYAYYTVSVKISAIIITRPATAAVAAAAAPAVERASRGAAPRVEAELLCNYIIAREHSLSPHRYIAQFKWPIVEGCCPSLPSGIIMRNECGTPFAEGRRTELLVLPPSPLLLRQGLYPRVSDNVHARPNAAAGTLLSSRRAYTHIRGDAPATLPADRAYRRSRRRDKDNTRGGEREIVRARADGFRILNFLLPPLLQGGVCVYAWKARDIDTASRSCCTSTADHKAIDINMIASRSRSPQLYKARIARAVSWSHRCVRSRARVCLSLVSLCVVCAASNVRLRTVWRWGCTLGALRIKPTLLLLLLLLPLHTHYHPPLVYNPTIHRRRRRCRRMMSVYVTPTVVYRRVSDDDDYSSKFSDIHYAITSRAEKRYFNKKGSWNPTVPHLTEHLGRIRERINRVYAYRSIRHTEKMAPSLIDRKYFLTRSSAEVLINLTRSSS